MSLKYYPSNTHLLNLHKAMNGNQTGLTNSNLLYFSTKEAGQNLKILSVAVPDYDKLILGEDHNVEHHLCGYGMYNEEAMVRLIGESAERYALISSSTILKDKFFSASYNELSGEKNVLPWELIDIFSSSDYEGTAKAGLRLKPLSKDDKIPWLWCPSLFDPNESICIPVQFLYTGVKLETRSVSAFSKGTAAHRSKKRALKAALLEIIEADAFMLKWYTDQRPRKVNIDDDVLQDMCGELKGSLEYDLLFEDLSMPEFPGHVFSAALLGKHDGVPTVINGIGAGLEPKQACYRTLAEALAIYPMADHGLLFSPEDCLNCDDRPYHKNLDSNVMYWASSKNAEKKLATMTQRSDSTCNISEMENFTSNIDSELDLLIDSLKSVSKYAVAFEITPIELIGSGWSIMRVFIPELVQLSLPSFPYSKHPRILQYGGVTNNMPHPLP